MLADYDDAALITPQHAGTENTDGTEKPRQIQIG